MNKQVIIFGCSRCGQNHEDVKVFEFTHPMVLDENTFTHYGFCPTNNEPIIIREVDKENLGLVNAIGVAP